MEVREGGQDKERESRRMSMNSVCINMCVYNMCLYRSLYICTLA